MVLPSLCFLHSSYQHTLSVASICISSEPVDSLLDNVTDPSYALGVSHLLLDLSPTLVGRRNGSAADEDGIAASL